jgi:superfamily II DNA or RNA helicase
MKISLIVDNRLRLPLDIQPKLIEKLKDAFTHFNLMRLKLEKMGVRGWALHREPRFIETWKIEDGMLTFPRGGISKVYDILEDNGFEIDIIDLRSIGEGLRGIPKSQIILRPFQEEIVRTCIKIENCVVRSPTGSGKTTSALALAGELNLPTLIIVWTGGLFDQWVKRAEVELGLDNSEIGIIRSGKIRIKPITIGMQQTLTKCKAELRNTFGLIIADEIQKDAATTFMDVIDSFPAKYRIGFSADEHRKDKKEFLIYDIFGNAAIDISQDKLISNGYVHDVEVRVVLTKFVANWYNELFENDYQGNIPKHIMNARLKAFDKLSNEMMNDEERTSLAIQIAMNEINMGKQVILLSHRREWCNRLCNKLQSNNIECGQMLGGVESQKEYTKTLEGLLNGTLKATVGTYQAIGQGIDLPSVSVGICCSPIANSVDGKPFFSQVRGRLCRVSKGKDGARLYYLYDENVYSSRPIKNLIKWNKSVFIQKDAALIRACEWLKNRT